MFVLDWRDGKPFPVDIGLDNRVKDGSSNPSAPHHFCRLDRLNQRRTADTRALAIQQLLPQVDGLAVAAVQEVIGGEQHQGAHFPFILLEGAIEQVARLWGDLLACLVVAHSRLGSQGGGTGAPFKQGEALIGKPGVVVFIPIEIELPQCRPAVEVLRVEQQGLMQIP